VEVLDTRIIDVAPRSRWEVVFRDSDRWQVGVYVPEYTSIRDVEVMEKHDAPELFYLVKGSIVLVLSNDLREIREVVMEPGRLYVIDEWHNAYRPNGVEGVALVVERTGVRTEYARIR